VDQTHAAEVFRALSVPNRVHILMLLKAHGPLPVKDIAETLELTSPAVSQHLKVLRQAGLVQAERQGYYVPYSVDEHALHDCCGMLVHVCAHPGRHQETAECTCKTETERLLHRREELLSELHRIETELDALREQGG
jgi:DNA-binding transcriptional ArsR family regulator